MTQSLRQGSSGVTIVVPAYNEAGAIGATITELKKAVSQLSRPSEIIVVDDGSTDDTSASAATAGVRVVTHPINSGYGRSILSGIEVAHYDTIAIVDADGTYPVDRLADLMAQYDKGFHMVVAARQGNYYEGSFWKRRFRTLFRWLSEYASGRDIPDINSGFRVFDRRPVLLWRASISAGFSFTTTITLLFMLNHLFVGYMPIPYSKRVGQSKVRMWRDSLRSLQIILHAIAQFNPMKLYQFLVLADLAGNLVCWGFQLSIYVVLAWNSMLLIMAIGVLSLTLIKPLVDANKIPGDLKEPPKS